MVQVTAHHLRPELLRRPPRPLPDPRPAHLGRPYAWLLALLTLLALASATTASAQATAASGESPSVAELRSRPAQPAPGASPTP